MKREFQWDLRSVAIVVATVVVMNTLLEVTDFGARMSQVSDSGWWQAAPWVLLVLSWAGMLVVLRRWRRSE